MKRCDLCKRTEKETVLEELVARGRVRYCCVDWQTCDTHGPQHRLDQQLRAIGAPELPGLFGGPS